MDGSDAVGFDLEHGQLILAATVAAQVAGQALGML